jgi:hypothetical protein
MWDTLIQGISFKQISLELLNLTTAGEGMVQFLQRHKETLKHIKWTNMGLTKRDGGCPLIRSEMKQSLRLGILDLAGFGGAERGDTEPRIRNILSTGEADDTTIRGRPDIELVSMAGLRSAFLGTSTYIRMEGRNLYLEHLLDGESEHPDIVALFTHMMCLRLELRYHRHITLTHLANVNRYMGIMKLWKLPHMGANPHYEKNLASRIIRIYMKRTLNYQLNVT